MAHTIKGLEILAAGTWNASTGKVTIPESALDEIVDAFAALSGTNHVKPHLKLGHTEAQKFFGQVNGIPALGWIESIRRVGSKLLADIGNVPDALFTLIQSGRYHNVSAEIYHDAEIGGKAFPWVLSAVALLGAELPAVKDLAGLANVLASAPKDDVDGNVLCLEGKPLPKSKHKSKKEETAMFSQEQVDQLVKAAVKDALSQAEVKTKTVLADATKQVEVLTKRAEQAEQSVKAIKAEAATEQATTLVDQAIKDGKLLPAQKEFALSMLQSTKTIKLSDGTEQSSQEAFKAFIEASGKQIDLKEKGDGGKDKTDFTTPAEEVDFKAKKLLSDDTSGKMTYGSAFDKVLASDRELATKYASGEDS